MMNRRNLVMSAEYPQLVYMEELQSTGKEMIFSEDVTSSLQHQEDSSISLAKVSQISVASPTWFWMRRTECWIWVSNHKSGRSVVKSVQTVRHLCIAQHGRKKS